MRLWTIQPKEVYNEVIRNGYCIADINRSTLLHNLDGSISKEFLRAYNFLVDEMDKRIERPEDVFVKTPWWAYYKYEGKFPITLDDINYLDTPGSTMIAIELAVPDNEVVLSDLDLWHYVLNDSWIDGSLTEEEWDLNEKYFNLLSVHEAEKLKRESWKNIFDIKYFKNDWCTTGENIQATFWVLRRKYIITATEFVVRESG